MLTNITWISVMNGSNAKIYSNSGKRNQIKLIKELISDAAHLRSSELGTERPGRVIESANPARHAVEPKTDLHKKEKIHFAQQIASFLENATNENQFTKLVLAASPKFLGEIRLQLHKSTSKLVSQEINKDLTHITEREV